MKYFLVIIFSIICLAQAPLPPKEEPKRVDMFIDPDTIDKDECPEGIDPKHCK